MSCGVEQALREKSARLPGKSFSVETHGKEWDERKAEDEKII